MHNYRLNGLTFKKMRRKLSKRYLQFKYRNGNGMMSKVTGLTTTQVKKHSDSTAQVPASVMKLFTTLPTDTTIEVFHFDILSSVPFEDNVTLKNMREFLKECNTMVKNAVITGQEVKSSSIPLEMDETQDVGTAVTAPQCPEVFNYSNSQLMLRVMINGGIEIHDMDGEMFKSLPKSEQNKYLYIPNGYEGRIRSEVIL